MTEQPVERPRESESESKKVKVKGIRRCFDKRETWANGVTEQPVERPSLKILNPGGAARACLKKKI